jgi:hypothetical protein
MNMSLLGMQRYDVDMYNHDVCEDCIIFISCHDLDCRMCENEFETVTALKDHVLQNKIRCSICRTFETSTEDSYCVTPDHVYLCDTCKSGAFTKRAR